MTITKVSAETMRTLCDILEDRADFYLMLAGFYFKPLTQDQIDALAEQDYTAYIEGDSLIDEGFDDIRRVLRKRHTGTRRILATEWTSTFGGAEAYKGRYCVPNASVFLDKSGSTYGWPRNAASRIYREHSLRLQGNSGMPESHLSFELEFLATLSREAAACLRSGDTAEAAALLVDSQTFIRESVLSWFPALRDLALRMLKTRFYRGVLRITEGYLDLDLETLEDVLAELGGAPICPAETTEAAA
ncbi:TorD/DmsD family molecular chaperone [Adlercreutzia caecimuris]|uniref:Uncharacterized protein n=1 Tax=Adlercreutzia caecimuris B7 TaxID=1235794 RepID=R9KUI5_9ACTN|nr:molecular chaperone TorD family protein [Adlercreutzia caecimuris]EOS50214.1 hypothetical protein C811_01838 [Adlercreutzia caecimuris B7]